MTMAILDEYVRVSKRHRCPVCKKPDWCLVSRNNPQNPREAICSRIESDRRMGDAGWLHIVSGEMKYARPLPNPVIRLDDEPRIDAVALAEDFYKSMTDGKMAYLAGELGVSANSLRRLGVGWASADRLAECGTGCKSRGAYTFPMFDCARRAVGIRLRSEDGFKYSLRGGKQGLFCPSDLPRDRPLMLTEGPTDAAALLDLGFSAIGRPNCSAGCGHIAAAVKNLRPPSIIVVADGDEAGMAGARKVSDAILCLAASVTVISPPAGVKDMRQWLSVGCTREDINILVRRAKEIHNPVRGFASSL